MIPKSIKLRDCIVQLNTGLNPRDNFSLGEGSIKYITAKNLNKAGYIDFSSCDYIDEQAKEIIHRRSDIQLGDILFASRAPIGHCHLITEDPSFYDVGESIFCIRVNKEIIVPEYLCLYLSSDLFIKMASKRVTGSVIQEIRISDLLDTDVVLPDKHVQTKIAKCIGYIDKKIELNKTICFNLESMAKLLYDYWFVQFDFPDENGKPYKSSGGKMVWNEELKREIPDGWEVSNAIKANVYTSDFTANGSFAGLAENVKYNEGEPYAVLVRIVDYNDNFANPEKFVYVNKHAYDYLKSSTLHGDEIIICNVGNIGLTFRCPHLGMPMTLGPNGIVVNSPEYNDYLFLYYTSSEGQQMLNSISSGSIQKKFNKTDFRNMPFVLPPKLILDEFTKIYGSSLEPVGKKLQYSRKNLINL